MLPYPLVSPFDQRSVGFPKVLLGNPGKDQASNNSARSEAAGSRRWAMEKGPAVHHGGPAPCRPAYQQVQKIRGTSSRSISSDGAKHA
jgi:hypothetical protein